MANPVVHFEVTGNDGKKLQKFYGDLFGWNVDANNPMDYGMVAAQEGGIGGGISGGAGEGGGEKGVTFYVQVPDLQVALDKAEQLGGKTVMPPTEIPGYVTMAMLTDPEGNRIGMIKA